MIACSNPNSWNETLPRSWREQQLVTKVKVEDPEKQKQRQEMTQKKSVSELAAMSSLSDLPIPAPIEKLMEMRTKTPGGTEG